MAEKIKVAIENGLERRPKRAASAQNFLHCPMKQLCIAGTANQLPSAMKKSTIRFYNKMQPE